MKKNLPIYEFVIDDSEDSGVKCISIVADPAFKSKLIAFNKNQNRFIELADSKKKKRKICGLALIPDVPIYRVDDVTNEQYMGFFSAETIEKIVEKFHDEMNNNKVNLNHDENANVDVILIEDFIVNSNARKQDLKEKGIEHENIMGSWFVVYRIKNEEVFNSILENQAKGNETGLSVEIYLDRVLVQMNKNNYNEKMKKDKKSLLEKIVQIFAQEEEFKANRANVSELGFDIEWNKPGEPVNQVTVDPNGNESLSPVGPGEFVTDAGVVVVDDSSNLVEVRPVPVEPSGSTAPIVSVSGSTETPIVASAETFEPYPWDKCLADQKKKGYSDTASNKICGYIRSKNMNSEDLTEDQIKTILAEPDELATTGSTNNPAAEVAPSEPNNPPVSQASLNKTIGEIVGTVDGDYLIEATVENGVVTEINVSSDVQLLRTQLEEAKKENKVLTDKLKEPIGEPVLEAPVEKKDWAKMSAYEKTLWKARQDK